jgi:hypothetical protein
MDRLAQLKKILGHSFYYVGLTPSYRPGSSRRTANISSYCADFRERSLSSATTFIHSSRDSQVFSSEQAAWAGLLEEIRRSSLWEKTALAQELAASRKRD